jgi:hypothetical protein
MRSSNWGNHPTCVVCWGEFKGGREPVVLRVTDPRTGALIREREQCCFCGRDTDAKIYLRRDGCNGKSKYHA